MHIDDDCPPGRREPVGDQLGEGRRVGREVRPEQGFIAYGIGIAQPAPREAVGVDGAHAHRPHLLPVIGEALGIDHQA